MNTLQRSVAGMQQYRRRRDSTVHDANGMQVREPHRLCGQARERNAPKSYRV